eukprot:285287_1
MDLEESGTRLDFKEDAGHGPDVGTGGPPLAHDHLGGTVRPGANEVRVQAVGAEEAGRAKVAHGPTGSNATGTTGEATVEEDVLGLDVGVD